MILFIDNFDSFSYNLVHLLQTLGEEVLFYRNSSITLSDLNNLEIDALVIGPGPGTPSEAGISKELILHYAGKIPILGVCLGHQSINEVFGGKTVRAKKPMHGKLSNIYHDEQRVFSGLPTPFQATRYHSLLVERDSLPKELEISAETDDGEVMAIRHRDLPIEGVQFHPESILSEQGAALFGNFFKKKLIK